MLLKGFSWKILFELALFLLSRLRIQTFIFLLILRIESRWSVIYILHIRIFDSVYLNLKNLDSAVGDSSLNFVWEKLLAWKCFVMIVWSSEYSKYFYVQNLIFMYLMQMFVIWSTFYQKSFADICITYIISCNWRFKAVFSFVVTNNVFLRRWCCTV